MKAVLSILGLIAASLAVVAAATFAAGDRQTLVPPPDAVAESFTRQVVERRYQLAIKHLSRDLRIHVSAADLRARYGSLRTQLGVPDTVRAELDWIGESRAAARVTITTDRGSAMLSVPFTREHGLWVVQELPAPAIALSARAHR